MKKLIAFLILSFFICFDITFFKIFSLQKESDILYKNKTEVSILFNNSYDLNEFIENLKIKCDKLDINFSQYVYTNDTTLNIYSSNIEYDNNIELIQGDFPKENSNQYISNISSNSDIENIGKIKFPKSDLKIKCYDFTQISNVGLGFKFIISTTNDEILHEIGNFLEQYGHVEILESKNLNNLNLNFRFLSTWFISLAVLILLIMISIILFIMNKKTKLCIQYLFGYDKKSMLINILYELLAIFLISGLVANTLVTLYFYINTKSNYIMNFFKYISIFLCICSLILLIFIILSFLVVSNKINIFSILKGKKLMTNFNTVILTSKILMSIIMLFVVGLSLDYHKEFKQKFDNIKYWHKAENVYKTTISSLGQDFNLSLDRNLNDRLCLLYKDLKENKNAFIINSTNYTVLYEDNNNITYLYDVNISEGASEYDISGKSITIDEGYLEINPIESADYEQVKNKLNSNTNTLNILVPEKYKSVENEIYNCYLDYFHFAKVTVDNIYNKALNLPLNELSKDELDINIIYVKNNQKYFTYSDISGSEADHHYITDPICIVYEENKVDSSYMGAYASDNLYFIDNSNGNAYTNISEYLHSSETNLVVPSVTYLFNDINVNINHLKSKINNMNFILFILIFVSIIFSIIYIVLYYKNNSYKLYLKTIMGYSYVYTYGTLLCIVLPINLIISLCNSLYFKNITILFIGLSILILEFIIIIFSTHYLNIQNINKIIKGEK